MYEEDYAHHASGFKIANKRKRIPELAVLSGPPGSIIAIIRIPRPVVGYSVCTGTEREATGVESLGGRNGRRAAKTRIRIISPFGSRVVYDLTQNPSAFSEIGLHDRGNFNNLWLLMISLRDCYSCSRVSDNIVSS